MELLEVRQLVAELDGAQLEALMLGPTEDETHCRVCLALGGRPTDASEEERATPRWKLLEWHALVGDFDSAWSSLECRTLMATRCMVIYLCAEIEVAKRMMVRAIAQRE